MFPKNLWEKTRYNVTFTPYQRKGLKNIFTALFYMTKGQNYASITPMFTEIQDIQSTIAPNTRLLGLDLGSKTIGIAVSDPALILASPITTINRTKFTADAVALEKIVSEYTIGGIILGFPLNMNGTEGPRCQSTRQFAENLRDQRDWTIPICLWDERLSTSAVEKFLIGDADMNRKRRGEVVDKMAAGFILQGALDFISRPNP